jgi:hypothetical protein
MTSYARNTFFLCLFVTIVLGFSQLLSAKGSVLTAEDASFHAYTLTDVKPCFSADSYISTEDGDEFFPLSVGGQSAPVVLSEQELQGVAIIADYLKTDIGAVTGCEPKIITGELPEESKAIILVGSLGNCDYIDQLVASGKLDVSRIKGKWEATLTTIVQKPFPGIDQALVIVGSDKRGAIYGIFDLSRNIGVSPWYWWADVPVSHCESLYVKPGTYVVDSPKVQYRGIFLNDEAPALTGWVYEKFGEFNQHFYKKVFELILRLRGNYLWPAMWGRSLWDDDPTTDDLADAMGVVLGTSHHEPLMRAHVEWQRYGKGKWDYSKNSEVLREFWREGIERLGDKESLVTIGMRGDGDEPMSEESNIALLEQIVTDQREIIADVTGEPAEKTPQVWALYKEVQEYYDKGMRVPDDVTLLLCDDNWGNIRKLPKLGAPERKGGYGIYYHFDYVGGPRNYKWINTNQISRTWEQMHLTYEYGAKKLWIVNVGDLKPMEYPISFFLDYAWNPEAIDAGDLPAYASDWACQQFGGKYSDSIADMLETYTKYNSRRKPELLDANTFALSEWSRVESDYMALASEAVEVGDMLDAAYKDAYYQLVAYPIFASSNLYSMYAAVARNHYLAGKGMIEANEEAYKVKQCFEVDKQLSDEYHQLKNGKWNHQMSQTHIGYTYWQQPEEQVCPEVVYVDEDNVCENPDKVQSRNPKDDLPSEVDTAPGKPAFLEQHGYVSMEMEHFARKVDAGDIAWKELPGMSYSEKSLTTVPVTHASVESPSDETTHLEYDFLVKNGGDISVRLYVSPTLDFTDRGALRYAVSIDGEAPQVVNIHNPEFGNWNKWVSENVIKPTSKHHLSEGGLHTLKVFVVDPGIVFQKIVIETGESTDLYLGPQESPRSN